MKRLVSRHFPSATRMSHFNNRPCDISIRHYCLAVASALVVLTLLYFTSSSNQHQQQQVVVGDIFQRRQHQHQHQPYYYAYSGSSKSNDQQQQRVKRILFWTTYFHWKDFEFGMGQEPFVRAGCRVTNCVTTDDRNSVNDSDAIIFHPINMNLQDLPPHRLARQRYVFLFYEAETSGRIYPVFQHPATAAGFFNWTMTYRRDSDIYSPQPYGILRRKKSSPSILLETLPVALAPGVLPPDPAVFLETLINNNSSINSSSSSSDAAASIIIRKSKNKIAWFVSKCSTLGRRERFFRQLFEFYPSIDVYGECGSQGLDCQPWKSLECDQLIGDYKFYIAAENSLCPDYVTEKFYRALQVGAVPIVYGGADYSAYAPPNSFIHAGDFQSPKALADYLILLDANPKLYARYFEWHKDWTVDRQPFDGWCQLCEKLNAAQDEPITSSKSYQDIAKWWFDDVPCLIPTSASLQSGSDRL